MEQLKEIQRILKAPKGQHNDFGNYNYRSCEDILEAVKPLLGDALLVVTDEMMVIGDRYYVKGTASISDGTSVVAATGYAREAESKKGMDAAQITGSASSYARKYALNGLFLIDDAQDDDTRKPSDFKRQSPAEDKKRDRMTPKQRDAIFGAGKGAGLSEEEIKKLVRWKAEQEKMDPKSIKLADFFLGKNDKDEWKMQLVIEQYNGSLAAATEAEPGSDIPF